MVPASLLDGGTLGDGNAAIVSRVSKFCHFSPQIKNLQATVSKTLHGFLQAFDNSVTNVARRVVSLLPAKSCSSKKVR